MMEAPETLKEPTSFSPLLEKLVQRKVEDKFYKHDPHELSAYESGLLYLYRPENFDRDQKVFVKKLYQNGQVVEINKKIPSDEVLASIRMNYLEEMEEGKLNKFVARAVVDREVDYYKDLRKRFKSADDGGRLSWQILTQEEILLRLAEVAALGPEEKDQLSQQFSSLKAKFTATPGPKQVKIPLIIEPVVEEPKIIIKEPPLIKHSPPNTIPEEELLASKKIPLKNKEPLIREEDEPWQKLPTAVELATVQAKEWENLLERVNKEKQKLEKEIAGELKRRLLIFDPRPVLEKVWHHRRFRNVILAGLILTNSTFNFKENEPTIFSALASGAKNLSETGQQLSAESQKVFEQMQKDFDYLQKSLPQVTATLEKIKAAVTPMPESKPVQAIPIKEKVPEPPAIPAPPPVAVKTEGELNMEFRSAESPVSPPGFVHPETPPESSYGKYIRPNWQSRTGSPYIKGLDYGAFSWAGVGDIQNPEDLDGIPVDANAKNFRMTMTGEGDIPRVAAVVEKAHNRGMKVAVNFSTPELAADKIKFRETIRRILAEARPDYLQYENEMGWLDEKGKPNQYYVGSHESIWKDYPAYVKIVQDEIRERERVTGNKTKLVIGSLGWDFLANNSKLDKFVQGLISAGVDFNSAYVDIHVFDHLDGDWDSQESIQRYLKILELNGIKDPKTLSLEMYIGSDQTPQYVARGFDVYHQRYGFDLVLGYPVTRSWRK